MDGGLVEVIGCFDLLIIYTFCNWNNNLVYYICQLSPKERYMKKDEVLGQLKFKKWSF